MKKQINPKMELLLTELQYRYDQLKTLNVDKIECSDGKILDLYVTDSLQLIEKLMQYIIKDEENTNTSI
jgi:hypothetical protein